MPVVVFVAPDFPAGVVEFTVELGALAARDDAVGLGAGLIPMNLRLVSFDLCRLMTCQRPVL